MLLILHILIAITTVLVSLVSASRPQHTGLTASKYAVVATVLSGVALALTSSVSLGHLCTSGIVVVGMCSLLIHRGNQKLAIAKS